MGRGREVERELRRGRSSSIVLASGGERERGETRGWVSERRVRLWWERWLVIAAWDVRSLWW